MEISIICPTYNNFKYLKLFLESIRNNSFYIYSSNKHVFFLVLIYNNNLYWDVDNQLLGRY